MGPDLEPAPNAKNSSGCKDGSSTPKYGTARKWSSTIGRSETHFHDSKSNGTVGYIESAVSLEQRRASYCEVACSSDSDGYEHNFTESESGDDLEDYTNNASALSGAHASKRGVQQYTCLW